MTTSTTLAALIAAGALRVVDKTEHYATVYYEPDMTAADIRVGIWRDGGSSYRAAMAGDLRLTLPEHAHLSDADLIVEALAEASRTHATSTKIEAEYTCEDGVWTWQNGTDADLGDALAAAIGVDDPDVVEAEALRLLGLVDCEVSAYRVKMIDRETPQSWISLCASVTPTNQDSDYCYYTVTTTQPESLEAALDADDDVVSYEIVERA